MISTKLRRKSASRQSYSMAVSALKRMSSSTSGLPSVTLYQYAICPFCNKVKAFLSYAGIQYEAIEVNPLTKAEIKWSTEYKKVPIASIDGEHVYGSDNIVDKLLDRENVQSFLAENRWNDSGMNLALFQESESAKQWSVFANDELASLLYPNICRTLSDSYNAFAYVNEISTFTTTQKLAIRGIGSLAMYFAASKVKKKRNITDEREALNHVLLTFETDGLSKGGKAFLSGINEPNLGDVSVYGTLRAIKGLPAHKEVIQDRGGVISEWYDRMSEKVERR